MPHYYRIRAFVEGVPEEAFIFNKTLGGALDDYKGLSSDNPVQHFDLCSIQLAMVHQVSFGETRPVFEDVTHLISTDWRRAPFEEALRFYRDGENGW